MSQIITGNEQGQAASSIHWCTAQWITEGCAEVFRAREGVTGIDLDPCANPGSIPRMKAKVNLCLPDNDGLLDEWGRPSIGITLPEDEVLRNAFVNSPFGRYWIHDISKDIMAPGEVEEKALVKVSADMAQAGVAMTPDALKKAAKKDKVLRKAVQTAKATLLEGYTSHTIGDWIQKCREQHVAYDMDVIQLGPASVDTAPWQTTIADSAAAVLFIKGRVRFELVDFETLKVVSVGDPAPMACAISLFTSSQAVLKRFCEVFADHGQVWIPRTGQGLLADAMGPESTASVETPQIQLAMAEVLRPELQKVEQMQDLARSQAWRLVAEAADSTWPKGLPADWLRFRETLHTRLFPADGQPEQVPA